MKLVIAGRLCRRGLHADGAQEAGAPRVLAKVVSEESDVKAVAGKVALGQGDAGFVYATDARRCGRGSR